MAKKGRGSKPKQVDQRAAKKRGGYIADARRTVFGKIGTMLEYPTLTSCDKGVNISAHRRILNSVRPEIKEIKAKAVGLSRAARMGCHVQDVVDVATGAYGSQATNPEIFKAKVKMVSDLFERRNGKPSKPEYSRDWLEKELIAMAESSVVIVQRAFDDEAMEYIRKRKKRIKASMDEDEKWQGVAAGLKDAEQLMKESSMRLPKTCKREVFLCATGFAYDLQNLKRCLNKYVRAGAAKKRKFFSGIEVVHETARQRAQTMAKVATRMKMTALVLPFATQLATQCIDELSDGASDIDDSKRRFIWLDSKPEAFVTLVLKVIARCIAYAPQSSGPFSRADQTERNVQAIKVQLERAEVVASAVAHFARVLEECADEFHAYVKMAIAREHAVDDVDAFFGGYPGAHPNTIANIADRLVQNSKTALVSNAKYRFRDMARAIVASWQKPTEDAAIEMSGLLRHRRSRLALLGWLQYNFVYKTVTEDRPSESGFRVGMLPYRDVCEKMLEKRPLAKHSPRPAVRKALELFGVKKSLSALQNIFEAQVERYLHGFSSEDTWIVGIATWFKRIPSAKVVKMPFSALAAFTVWSKKYSAEGTVLLNATFELPSSLAAIDDANALRRYVIEESVSFIWNTNLKNKFAAAQLELASERQRRILKASIKTMWLRAIKGALLTASFATGIVEDENADTVASEVAENASTMVVFEWSAGGLEFTRSTSVQVCSSVIAFLQQCKGQAPARKEFVYLDLIKMLQSHTSALGAAVTEHINELGEATKRLLTHLPHVTAATSQARDSTREETKDDAWFERANQRAIKKKMLEVISNEVALLSRGVEPSDSAAPSDTPSDSASVDTGSIARAHIWVPPPIRAKCRAFCMASETPHEVYVDRTMVTTLFRRFARDWSSSSSSSSSSPPPPPPFDLDTGSSVVEPGNLIFNTLLNRRVMQRRRQDDQSSDLETPWEFSGSITLNRIRVSVSCTRQVFKLGAEAQKAADVENQLPPPIKDSRELILIGADPGVNTPLTSVTLYRRETQQGQSAIVASRKSRRNEAVQESQVNVEYVNRYVPNNLSAMGARLFRKRQRRILNARRKAEKSFEAQGFPSARAAIADVKARSTSMNVAFRATSRKTAKMFKCAKTFVADAYAYWARAGNVREPNDKPTILMLVGEQGVRVNRGWSQAPVSRSSRGGNAAMFMDMVTAMKHEKLHTRYVNESATSRDCPCCCQALVPARSGRPSFASESKRRIITPNKRNGRICVNAKCEFALECDNRDVYASINMIKVYRAYCEENGEQSGFVGIMDSFLHECFGLQNMHMNKRPVDALGEEGEGDGGDDDGGEDVESDDEEDIAVDVLRTLSMKPQVDDPATAASYALAMLTGRPHPRHGSNSPGSSPDRDANLRRRFSSPTDPDSNSPTPGASTQSRPRAERNLSRAFANVADQSEPDSRP